jgi:hypothetical protein
LGKVRHMTHLQMWFVNIPAVGHPSSQVQAWKRFASLRVSLNRRYQVLPVHILFTDSSPQTIAWCF